MSGHNNRTLLIALGANLGIAVSKFVAAALTGSSAMLTEGVHSVVDSTNQVLLIWGRRQSRKPADHSHPLGYGREIYFWSFVVAVLVFALGAGVSVYEGIIHIAHPEEAVSPLIAYTVLIFAFLLEGGSTWLPFAISSRRRARWAGGRRSAGQRIRRPSSYYSRTGPQWRDCSWRRSDWECRS
jgi:cation diffusion facilitator family transporter